MSGEEMLEIVIFENKQTIKPFSCYGKINISMFCFILFSVNDLFSFIHVVEGA